MLNEFLNQLFVYYCYMISFCRGYCYHRGPNSSHLWHSEEPIASEPEGLDLLRKCLDELKLVTRRYSKKQIKWIQNRFLGSHDRQVPPLYSLDTSDVSQWMANVYSPAIDIIESYINERQPKTTPMESVQHPGSGLNEEVGMH